MHKIYENDDLMMYFKKKYCHCCGKVLQRKKTERIIRKNDPEHKSYCTIGTTYKPYGDILVIGKEYYCESCNKTFTCKKQSEIIDTQKSYKKLIVSNEEICTIKNHKIKIENNKILKMRWLLLFPIFGELICIFKIFTSYLREKTNKKDSQKNFIIFSISIYRSCANNKTSYINN